MLLKEAVVEADGIIPPLREQDPLSSESDPDESTDGGDVGYAKGVFCVQISLSILELNRLLNNNCFFGQKCWTLLKNSQLR